MYENVIKGIVNLRICPLCGYAYAYSLGEPEKFILEKGSTYCPDCVVPLEEKKISIYCNIFDKELETKNG